MSYLLFVVLIFGFMWLALIRPQQQRARKQRELVNTVNLGDYVVTQSGLIGRVADATPERVQLEISDGVFVEFLRLAIFRRMEPSELAFGALSAASDVDDDDTYEETVDDDSGDDGGEAQAADDEEPAGAAAAPSPKAASGDGGAAVVLDPPAVAADLPVPGPEQDRH
ncbi:MAG TPA: preprotein translocase subunit YajC [Acidimicrobiales bacterium]|jgi:preprotein translocase subunit YajC|nr:preprotein translocase subunit YajC [Acidimicrobiales bacterium]